MPMSFSPTTRQPSSSRRRHVLTAMLLMLFIEGRGDGIRRVRAAYSTRPPSPVGSASAHPSSGRSSLASEGSAPQTWGLSKRQRQRLRGSATTVSVRWKMAQRQCLVCQTLMSPRRAALRSVSGSTPPVQRPETPRSLTVCATAIVL